MEKVVVLRISAVSFTGLPILHYKRLAVVLNVLSPRVPEWLVLLITQDLQIQKCGPQDTLHQTHFTILVVIQTQT